MKTKTIQIEVAILNEFDVRRHLIVPNVTPLSDLVGFEADMLVLTSSGYATAFEIKVSRSDLKNDLKKSHIKNLSTSWRSYRGKNCLEFYYRKLKYFNYAVPKELEQEALNQIPNFCGLYVFENNEYPKLNRFYQVRGAKKINNYKWDEKNKFELARLGTMRISNLKRFILSNI